MPQIQRTIALGRYDLVDVHYAYPDGVAGDKLARRLGKPFVLSLRGSDIHLLTKFPKRRELIRSTLKRADAVVAVSSDLRQEAVELGADPNKVYVMPNGVDTAVFFPRDWREARQALGWPLDHEVILSVGRLVPVKGFNLLIRAMREVRERLGRLVRCYIVGEGESRSNLENEVRRLGLEQEVILPGPVSPDRLPLWYSAANLFVLLSQNEGCPNVVLEALACGTPVVAAAVGGLPELVREGVCGLLVKDRSEAEAARRIEQALRMKWDRALIGSSESVKDWDDVARAQVRLFEDVVQAQ
jgi:glycosyltransferase involved in cell wall biosynthesis